ncbi:MAG: DUF4405 domain-containing protein [Chitinophagales bacterium]
MNSRSDNTFFPSRKRFIIYLDTLLLLLFILALSPRMTGLAMHELLGIIFFIPLIVHLLIAWPWIRKSFKQFFYKSTGRSRLNLFINAVLFLLVITEIVSGLAISQVTLPFAGIRTINDRTWRSVHNLTLNFTVLLMGLHIAINWEWIISIFKKRVYTLNQTPVKLAPNPGLLLWRIFVIILFAGVFAFSLYSLLGRPTVARLYIHDEIARFKPRLDHGIGQFAGEAFLIAIVAFIARRWLRIRL